MNKVIKLLVILLTFFLILPYLQAEEHREVATIPLSPSGYEARGNHWLFIIGINEYTDWSRMDTAVNDAKAIKDVLLRRYYFDKYHLVELYNEKATRKNILGKLRFLSRRVGPDDSIVIFYAGHGNLDPITKESSWIPVEGGIEDPSTWVTSYDIRSYLRISAIKAKHILLISCASFSGDFFRNLKGELPKATDKVIRKAYKLASRQAITSGGLEPESENGISGNSIFAHSLVRVLEENRKPFLIPSDFFPDVKDEVVENAGRLPGFGPLDGIGGEQGGEMVFLLKQYGGVDEKVKDRQIALERVKKLERQSKVAEEKERVAIDLKKKELTRLDENIKEAKEHLETGAHPGRDSHTHTLDDMLAMVKDKEHQEKQLAGLRRGKEAGERNRLAEIERLKREHAEKKQAAIKEDIRKYEKIVSSEYGSEMKEAAWNNLVNRHPEAGSLAVGDINGLKSKLYPKPVLRSSYKKLSVAQAQSIPHVSIHENTDWGFYGHSTIQNNYELKTINNDKVVIDHATGLMWLQSGTVKYLNHEKSMHLLEKINDKGYAGHNDWRLPTLEEAVSLLESDKNNGLFIDPVFDKFQSSIWIGGNFVRNIFFCHRQRYITVIQVFILYPRSKPPMQKIVRNLRRNNST